MYVRACVACAYLRQLCLFNDLLSEYFLEIIGMTFVFALVQQV